MKCEFFTPIDWQGNTPVTEKDIWNFKEMVCDEEFEVLIENPITPANFRLVKQYSYGEITSILLMGIILFFIAFLTLKKLFFHDTTSIHTISQKKF